MGRYFYVLLKYTIREIPSVLDAHVSIITDGTEMFSRNEIIDKFKNDRLLYGLNVEDVMVSNFIEFKSEQDYKDFFSK